MTTSTLETFTCSKCQAVKPVQKSGGTGYAVDRDTEDKTCYACCAGIDRQYMRDHGRILLYMTLVPIGEYTDRYGRRRSKLQAYLTNWPGTLKFRQGYVTKGNHNMAGHRYDHWFKGPDGFRWHAVRYGDNTQIAHCRRTKSKWQGN